MATIALSLTSNANAAQWVAGAAGFWHDDDGGSHVGIGYARESTANEAVSVAVSQCQSSGPDNCKVFGPYNSGCLYLSVGTTDDGTAYGVGSTPDRALEQCENEGGTCKTPIGGCVGR